ncbi:MAG: D-alanyl-D-alanine carboxypeptidase/D-alanyl-D-alanine endopeptidase [Phocaeicola sp.]|uniref:D-alanyl-D-alanine carboxypeptidase/D-alanyl-D-alanine endopeptidase n=1 Tax=Phocaeicola sp. TaxID=2773926 RepID=UPI003F9F01FA
MRNIVLFLLVLITNVINAQSLQQKLNALVNSETLRTSEIGVTVFDLTADKSLYKYQDEKLYRPASTEKIITSVTALARLGESYTFDTKLCYTGEIKQDTLHGNLYVIGHFDPLFSDEDLNHLADAVIANGIHFITDTLAADVSMMDSVYWGPGWSWDDTPSSDQPYLSPLMLNQGCVEVTVSPQEKGTRPAVDCMPFSDYYQIDNRAISHDPTAGKLKITRNWLSNGNIISITGNVTRRTTVTLSIQPSERFFLHTLVNRLNNRGVRSKYVSFINYPDSLDKDVRTLLTLSRPLREVLDPMLKKSNNLCAESVFYQVAANMFSHKYLTAKDGADAIKTFLSGAIGKNPEDYNIVDGSGLSLYNYLSPELLLAFLKYAYNHKEIFDVFYDYLPIAGVDGTLKNRMKKTKAQNNVHAKTGTVKGVSSLAGYVRAGNGHMLAFVIINQNIMKQKEARDIQDKICITLAGS